MQVYLSQSNEQVICNRSSIDSLSAYALSALNASVPISTETTTVNAKMQQSKNLRHWFGNYKTIKNSKNTEKRPNVNKTLIQNECAFTIVQYTSKGVSAFHVVHSWTWPTATGDCSNFDKLWSFLKWKTRNFYWFKISVTFRILF